MGQKTNFTIFTTPKPLKGHSLMSFLNALGTWQRLDPSPEIIVFGEDEILDNYNVMTVREYQRNERGLPYINDLFVQAQDLATNDILVYANDDMLFLPDLAVAVRDLANRVEKPFLATGQRWDVDIHDLLLFDNSWPKSLVNMVERMGTLHPPAGKDYFIFKRPLGFPMRHLYVGRPGWDVVLVSDAIDNGLMVIDTTEAITAIHANHDYSHVPGGLYYNITKLEEWKYNIDIFRSVVMDISRTEPPNFPFGLSCCGDIVRR